MSAFYRKNLLFSKLGQNKMLIYFTKFDTGGVLIRLTAKLDIIAFHSKIKFFNLFLKKVNKF